MRRWIPIRAPAFGLGFFGPLLGMASSVRAQNGGEASTAAAGTLWEKLQEPLSPWATAVFVWLVLFVVMAFIIGLAWLSRSRRY